VTGASPLTKTSQDRARLFRPSLGQDKEPSRAKKSLIPRREAEYLVREALKKDQRATVKIIHEKTGVSAGAIVKTAAWKAAREAKKGPTDQRLRQLPDSILTSRGVRDESAQLDDPDQRRKYFIDHEDQETKNAFILLSPAQQESFLELYADQKIDDIKERRSDRLP
jgi:hypothetical protein